MEYVLSHKHTEVALVDIGEDGLIRSLDSVISLEHLPAQGVQPLMQWWYDRCIPSSRYGIAGFLDGIGFCTMHHLLPGSLGMNLSDQYWIRPKGSDVFWDDANFYENPFPEEFGNGLMTAIAAKNPVTPDIATDGVLAKRWIIEGGKRRLVKSGTEPFRQEPVNEAVATMIMEAQGIPCAHYDQIWVDDVPCSICDCFVTPQTELVSAMRIVDAYGLPSDSKRDAYESACAKIGLDVRLAMAQQDFIDYMMMNGDRHLGNYGLIRDADTLEWIGPAPIFDTGTSLMCRRATTAIPKAVLSGTSDAWAERLFHSDLDWLDVDALHRSIDDASKMIRSTAARLGGEGFDDARADALIEVLRSRADGLEDLFA